MKSVDYLLLLSLATVLTAHPSQSSDLTVHEWGTFTSVAGEDGRAVDWNTLGCSDLPKFVNDYGYRNFKFQLSGTVRMETPVMFFYSPRELDAHVKVEFPEGLITEWYPKAEYEVFQQGKDGSPHRLEANLNGINTSLQGQTGAIEWHDIKVQPSSTAAFPVESAPSRYYAARETDAAPLAVGDENEKFLFYRGVGRLLVPLSARVADDGSVKVENRGAEAVPSVILFENRGGYVGYRNAGALNDTIMLEKPSLDRSLSQLLYDLQATLVAQGLFPREAQAMIETWRDSWFEEGSRLIYVLPSSAVQKILPLEIEPAPSEIMRVFVGRIELVTPETKRAVEAAIAKRDWPAVDRYNRFLKPILERIYPGDRSKEATAEQMFRNYQMSFGATCR